MMSLDTPNLHPESANLKSNPQKSLFELKGCSKIRVNYHSTQLYIIAS